MNKNQTITVRIESLSSDGFGVAHHDGQVVFVPTVAEGDFCEVKIIKLAKTYSIGKVEKIIEYSKKRIVSSCPAFPKCGGCCFHHISYEEELKIKKQSVIDAVKRIGGLDIEVNDVIPSPEIYFYRNKAQFPIGKFKEDIVFGFYGSHSHNIVACENCKIQPDIFNPIMKSVVRFIKEKNISVYDETAQKGIVRHGYLRINKKGKVMLCLVINADNFKFEKAFVDYMMCHSEITSIFLNFNCQNSNVILSDNFKCIYGSLYMEDDFFGLTLRMSPDSFYQVNRGAAELLYKTAFDLIPKIDYSNVFDLYCGVGSIGLSLEKYAEMVGMKISRLIGYEVVEKAVENAKINAQKNNILNTEFFVGNLATPPVEIMRKYPPSLIIIDPPRKGVSKGLLELFKALDIPYILYISCDPTTLARDLRILSDIYSMTNITPVDLFPRTGHVETCVLLSHKNQQTSLQSL